MNFKCNFILTFFLIFSFLLFPSSSFADDFIENDTSIFTSSIITSDSKDSPSLNARHAVIFDRASKTILYGKNENEQCKMASTTKILTAIIVLENISDLSAQVTISSKSANTGRF